MKPRLKLALALAAVLSLSAGAAHGSSGLTLNSVSMTATSADTPTGSTTDSTITVRGEWMVTELGADGVRIAHEDGSGDWSNVPQAGDIVGQAVVRTRYLHAFCVTRTYTYDIVWDSTANTSWTPASGTLVAYLEIDAGFVTVPAYVVRETSGSSYEYRIETDMPGYAVCSNTTTEMDTTTYAYAGNSSSTNRVVAKTPVSTGTYTAAGTLTDSNNGTHTDSATYTIS